MLLRLHTFLFPPLWKYIVYGFNLGCALLWKPKQISSNVEMTRWRVEKIIQGWGTWGHTHTKIRLF